MRYGFTTGSCAAAAAAAACYMLLTGRKKEEMTILTPKGISYTAKLVDISINESSAACAIVKMAEMIRISRQARILSQKLPSCKKKACRKKVGRKIRLMLCSRSSYVAEKASAE